MLSRTTGESSRDPDTRTVTGTAGVTRPVIRIANTVNIRERMQDPTDRQWR